MAEKQNPAAIRGFAQQLEELADNLDVEWEKVSLRLEQERKSVAPDLVFLQDRMRCVYGSPLSRLLGNHAIEAGRLLGAALDAGAFPGDHELRAIVAERQGNPQPFSGIFLTLCEQWLPTKAPGYGGPGMRVPGDSLHPSRTRVVQYGGCIRKVAELLWESVGGKREEAGDATGGHVWQRKTVGKTGSWEIRFGDESATVADTLSGFRIVKVLLETPNQSHTVESLLVSGASASGTRADLAAGDLLPEQQAKTRGKASGDEQEALGKLKQRLDEINQERDKQNGSGGWSEGLDEQYQREKACIRQEVRRLTGKRGRLRPTGKAESDRINVHARIRSARGRLQEKGLESLADHLARFISESQGSFVYHPPEPAPDWQF